MKKITIIGTSLLMVIALASFFFYQSCSPDPCKTTVCNNGGTCADGYCICAAGFEGIDCSTLSRDKLVKVWHTTSNSCDTAATGAAISITANTTNNKGLKIAYFSHLTCQTGTILISCTMTGTNTFVIDNSTYCGIIFTGTGSLDGSTLTVTYSFNDTSGFNVPSTGNCTAIYN